MGQKWTLMCCEECVGHELEASRPQGGRIDLGSEDLPFSDSL